MTYEQANALFSYDPITGSILWKVSPGGKGRSGSEAGTFDLEGYRVIRYKGKGYKAHRIAWLLQHKEFPNKVIDHINGDKSDNRISNLREADFVLNASNVKRPNKSTSSGYRWVSWFSQYQKWKAMFQYNKKIHFVGHFDCPKEAYEAALTARKEVGAPI
jgi:hypothetical protein